MSLYRPEVVMDSLYESVSARELRINPRAARQAEMGRHLPVRGRLYKGRN